MSDAKQCPLCDVASEGVAKALRDDTSCPHCGTSAVTMRDVGQLLQSGAGADLLDRIRRRNREGNSGA